MKFQPFIFNPQMLSFPNMPNTMGSKMDGLAVRDFFLSKNAEKQLFGVTQIMITRLWRGITPSILKIETFFTGVSENLGHKNTCEKRGTLGTLSPPIFWIFRQI